MKNASHTVMFDSDAFRSFRAIIFYLLSALRPHLAIAGRRGGQRERGRKEKRNENTKQMNCKSKCWRLLLSPHSDQIFIHFFVPRKCCHFLLLLAVSSLSLSFRVVPYSAVARCFSPLFAYLIYGFDIGFYYSAFESIIFPLVLVS